VDQQHAVDRAVGQRQVELIDQGSVVAPSRGQRATPCWAAMKPGALASSMKGRRKGAA
jgi:hypothetical protein